MKKLSASVVFSVFGLWIFAAAGSAQTAATAISIDGTDSGRIFDGIGGLSAGASSRLLIDYPEKQRSEILDYLFKPNFGAALQINKVEIGGDMNSTDGSEPSHMRTRDDQNYQRGYEWWLMEESKKRNPQVKLYGLEWGAPHWINPQSNNVWTDDNVTYLLNWIQHAKSDHGLTIDYMGGWNERRFDTAWYEKFRAALNSGGYEKMKIVADDGSYWDVGKAADDDSAFASSFDIIGQHYPAFPLKNDPKWQASLHTGKPLWGSEIGSARYDSGSAGLARLFNRGYVDARMTAFINWATLWSVYSNLPYYGDGLMLANEPWSGHYIVSGSIWIVAHTTQFAQPGWQYLDQACGYFAGGPGNGSYVVLRSPNHSDYSLIAETADAGAAQTATFTTTGGLSTGVLHVWCTNLRSSKDEDWFVQQPDIASQNGTFTMTFAPGCVYSLTTTTGQAKGMTTPPPSLPFPLPYRDDFQEYPLGATPRYFSDQQGTFEIAPAGGGRDGKCLRQVVTARPVLWAAEGDPSTLIGDSGWKNYRLNSDVLLEQPGYVDLVGRMASVTGDHSNMINGYHLRLTDKGHWSLLLKRSVNETVLASGDIASAAGTGQWHTLSLIFSDGKITAGIDGATIVDGVSDNSYAQGSAGYQVSSWQNAEFMNFEALPSK